jgi:N6-adenosine-specific RNA methylase IME4
LRPFLNVDHNGWILIRAFLIAAHLEIFARGERKGWAQWGQDSVAAA